MRINGVRSALAYRFNQEPAARQATPQQPFKPQPAEDKGIIIVGGKPKTSAEERGIIIVGGKPQSSVEERGIIIVGGKPDNSVRTENGILFVGGRSVIR
jgi:hypothetical protein